MSQAALPHGAAATPAHWPCLALASPLQNRLCTQLGLEHWVLGTEASLSCLGTAVTWSSGTSAHLLETWLSRPSASQCSEIPSAESTEVSRVSFYNASWGITSTLLWHNQPAKWWICVWASCRPPRAEPRVSSAPERVLSCGLRTAQGSRDTWSAFW